MGEQRIIIEIGPDGSIKAKTDGFRGDACMTAIQELLGKDEFFASVKPSDEFYQETGIEQTDKIEQRRD